MLEWLPNYGNKKTTQDYPMANGYHTKVTWQSHTKIFLKNKNKFWEE